MRLRKRIPCIVMQERIEKGEEKDTGDKKGWVERKGIEREKSSKKRITPIIIDEALNKPALMDEISTIVGARFMARMENCKSHTFEMQNQK
ncbi:hypothetical protein NPIL_103451 [Nephila pilipes]|uniref:Uncharacterized protein n=1 Tax=Nephila pilipes TaxID=299642 RepID=A0A8X6Q1U5_NEPPI|nr:hypothetical protein NPIL_103451 [Nephila pilipes]